MTVVYQFLANAETEPQALALVENETTISYADLRKRVLAAANFLEGCGVGIGDRVVLSAASTIPFVTAYLATHLAGAVAVPVDPRAPPGKVKQIYERVAARVCLGHPQQPQSGMSYASFDDLEAGDASVAAAGIPDEVTSPADILFTSGTTQAPKGVVLSHGAIHAAAKSRNTFIGNTRHDRELLTLPLGHAFGLGRLRCTLCAGGAMILLQGLTAPAQFFTAIDRWTVTGMAGVPPTFELIFRLSGDELGRYSKQLSYVEIGSAPMPMENKLRLIGLLPETRLCMHYGLTEAAASAFIEFHESRHKLDSIGKASPGVEIKVADRFGDVCAVGEVGRILVKSPARMTEYWDDAERTSEVIEGDYLVTHDLGHEDSEGFLYLDARESDIINVGGRKVAPQEVESELLACRGVRDCACVGMRDSSQVTGVAMVAFVVFEQGFSDEVTPRELIVQLRRSLEPYKVPARIMSIAEIPRSRAGKILRRQLEELGAE